MGIARAPRRRHVRTDRPRGRRPPPSADFYRMAVESLSEYALITMRDDLTISSWSGPASVMFGYDEREVLGRPVSLLFTPEDLRRGVDRREFVLAEKNGRADDERWHVRKDGRRIWCYGLSFPLKDAKGGLRGYVKLLRDDSERKRRDDLMRENEERLRLAAESTGLGTWDFDVAGSALRLSPRAAELFGLGREHASAGFEQFVEKVSPEDRERVKSAFERCLRATKDRDADVEYRVAMPDGRVRWVRTLVRGFCDRGRAEGVPPLRLLGTVVDITAEREQGKQERDLNKVLESRIAQRTAQLTALNKELESFAYSASHDLRAPLRKIAAYSQAILESRGSRLDDADRRHFERIRAATSAMHDLLDDTLALSLAARKPLEWTDCGGIL